MTVQSITHPWKTTDITVMSNVTSVRVRGNKITKIGAVADSTADPIPQQTSDQTSAIYLDLDVRDPHSAAAILQNTQELGLILQPQDALELGLMLTAMGLENYDKATVAAAFERLSNLIAEYAT